MSRILIIDDEPAIGWSLREMLSDEGHSVEVAASVEAGLETCARFEPEAMLLDVRLPGRDGLSALPEFRSIVPNAPVVVMTAFGDLDTAVRAVNAGAFDYLVKPFDLESVSRIVAHALAERDQHAAGREQPAATATDAALLVGSSPPMQEVFKQISLVAPTELPVLITGETGTGKDLAARAIHAHSPRRHRPFVATSLGALAPSVIESELFGHVRGAFTGATADRPGLFAIADGGTLFLDEIGEAPLDLQVKLLRALETREVTPVGAAAPRKLDVRVIAATNRDLVAAIAAGTFREDLYHRLHVFPIHMPPLAARRDDIDTLAAHFLARQAAGRATPTISEAFRVALRSRPWPGNGCRRRLGGRRPRHRHNNRRPTPRTAHRSRRNHAHAEGRRCRRRQPHRRRQAARSRPGHAPLQARPVNTSPRAGKESPRVFAETTVFCHRATGTPFARVVFP